MSLAILFHFLCAQHVSNINISIIRSLIIFCWITTLVQHTSNQEQYDKCVIQQNSRKLLMMDILMSETCWAHKKWNKIASDIKLVFYSSTIIMMHGPINISHAHVFKFCLSHKFQILYLHNHLYFKSPTVTLYYGPYWQKHLAFEGNIIKIFCVWW